MDAWELMVNANGFGGNHVLTGRKAFQKGCQGLEVALCGFGKF